MRISWITNDKHVPSLVEYGKEPGKYTLSTTGEHTSYRYFFYRSGKIHHVKIGPLDPNTIYYYRCGGNAREFSFKTPPATFPIRFAVSGLTSHTFQVVTLRGDIRLLDMDIEYLVNLSVYVWDMKVRCTNTKFTHVKHINVFV